MKTAQRRETFTLVVPQANHVELVGDFTDWEQHPIPLKKQTNGVWKATKSLPPGTYEYRFLVDGKWHDDETCTLRRPNSFGGENCVREVK